MWHCKDCRSTHGQSALSLLTMQAFNWKPQYITLSVLESLCHSASLSLSEMNFQCRA